MYRRVVLEVKHEVEWLATNASKLINGGRVRCFLDGLMVVRGSVRRLWVQKNQSVYLPQGEASIKSLAQAHY